MATQGAANQKPDNVVLAVGAILFTDLALSLGDALVKQVSAGFVIWQIFVLRSAIIIPILLVVVMATGRASLRPKALGWTALRSLLLVAMWVIYYVSLPNIQLSVAAAAYYTLPLFITILSALLAREPVSWMGWAAVATGFLGVLLIIRPSADAFNLYALFPLASALLFALAMILTRTKCRNEHPLVLALWLNVTFVFVGLGTTALIAMLLGPDRSGFLVASWTPLGPREWLAMALLALSLLIGSIGAAVAYQSGPPAIVGTFDFAYVGFAVLWGLLFFGEVPDLLALAGIAMIVLAGVLSVRQRTG